MLNFGGVRFGVTVPPAGLLVPEAEAEVLVHRHHQHEELPRSRPRVPLELHPTFLRDPVVWDQPPTLEAFAPNNFRKGFGSLN